MPIILTTAKKHIVSQSETIAELEKNCKSCKLLRGKTAKEIFTYTVYDDYPVTDYGHPMVAVARYDDNTYAIYAPKYLSDKQFVIAEFVLRDLKPDYKIIVFQQKTFEAFKQYSCVLPVNVQLYI